MELFKVLIIRGITLSVELEGSVHLIWSNAVYNENGKYVKFNLNFGLDFHEFQHLVYAMQTCFYLLEHLL